MTKKQMARVIEMVAAYQLFDLLTEYDFEELVNEAWVAVLEAIRFVDKVTPGFVFSVARRAIINFKVWNISAVSVPKSCAHQSIEIAQGLKYLIGVPEIVLQQVGSSDGSGRRELRLAIEKARKELRELDKFCDYVVGRILDGALGSEIIEELQYLEVPCARWYAYNSCKWAKDVFAKYLIGG